MHAATFTGTDRRAEDLVDLLAVREFDVDWERRVTRTLLDTFDGRLHSAGFQLEARNGGDKTELILFDGASAARVDVDRAPQRAQDLEPGPVRSRLAGITQGRALLPVVTLTARMRSAVQRDELGKAVAAVAVYDNLTLADGTPLPSWTAEVTELSGHPEPAVELRATLTDLKLTKSPRSTLQIAAEAAGADIEGFRSGPTLPLDPTMKAFDGFRAVFAHHTAALQANWQGTIDDLDEEFLHDARVAIRRTRSVLRFSKTVLPVMQRRRFADGFAWLGRVTGPARDLDVHVLDWERFVAPLPPDAREALETVFEVLIRERAEAHEAVRRAFTSPHAASVLASWTEWLQTGDATGAGPDAGKALGKVVPAMIERANRKLLRDGRRIGPHSPPEDLHELRKEGKRLRYLLESFGGVYDAGALKAFVKRMKQLQENLGSLQDAATYIDTLESLAQGVARSGANSAPTLLAVGRLIEQLDAQRAAARAEFSERFADFDSPKTQRALTNLLKS